jgi:hypothetical protein
VYKSTLFTDMVKSQWFLTRYSMYVEICLDDIYSIEGVRDRADDSLHTISRIT